MKISIDWLTEFIALSEKPDVLAHLLTMGGLEVEGLEEYETVQGGLKGLVIGEVLETAPHPNADKLTLTKVDIGADVPSPIVCGAPNVAAGQKVVVATVGCTLYPKGSEPFTIKKAKIRGEVSQGMICAEDEIGMGTSHDGIMVLATDLPNGTLAAEHFNVSSDHVLEIGLTPNRIDAASHYGVARDLKALLKREICFPDISSFTVDNHDLPIPVEITEKEGCQRYCGVTLTGITVKPSPEWLKQRLLSIGLQPINNVVDITNYVLHSLGQPMHAFDADQINGKKIVVSTLPEGTKFTTLDEKERTLTAQDLMICNGEGPMCIAGVFGGIHSGVTEKTTSVFLESAYFDPGYVRRTAQHHGLKTDASFRFERGADPNMAIPALKWAAILIKELAGGQISSEIVDVYPKPIEHFEVQIKYSHVRRLIGQRVGEEQIKGILQSLDITILDEDAEGLKLSVPPYRVDVQREADVIEEILRIFGYDEIEPSPIIGSDYLANIEGKDLEMIRHQTSYTLAGYGFQEIMTNSLTTSKYTEQLPSIHAGQHVEVLNALSADLDVMRQSFLHSGLEVILHNINRKQTNLRLFEFGKTYQKVGKGSYREKEWLSLWVTGNEQEESWIGKTRQADFHTLSMAIHGVMARMNLSGIASVPMDSEDYAYGLQYQLNGKTLAKAGLIKPETSMKAEIEQPVYYAEIDWQALVKLFDSATTYQAITKFPEVRRDLSLVMDKSVRYEEIKAIAHKTEKSLLKRMNVFDVYEGENLGGGKKSYSVSFVLQADKTLTDKQIDKAMNRLMNAFERELNILIRK